MTTYRLFPSTNGPASATSFSSSYIAGTLFEVTQGGMWFQGYWWWVCPTGGLTAPQKCALWSIGRSGAGTLVPGSVVTSGTLATGWNYIPLATPIQIAISTTYVAAIGVNGNFPDTPSQYGSAQPFSAGIVNGPLSAFSDTGGSFPDPYGNPQGIFTTGGSDPSVTMPVVGNSSSNLWADVQVSDTAPPAYAGTWRLWPNNFQASAGVGNDAAVTFLLATEIRLTQACTTSYLWFYSPAGATSLPTWAGVYRIAGQALAAANAAPSWLTPDGSGSASAAGGWCKCALSATLPAGSYKAGVYNSAGASGTWSPFTFGYWQAGGGAPAGITSGPLYAPPMASATSAYVFFTNPGATPPYTDGSTQEPSQGTFAMTGPQYPYLAVDFNFSGPAGAIAESFWVDLEVSLAPIPNVPPYTASMSSM